MTETTKTYWAVFSNDGPIKHCGKFVAIFTTKKDANHYFMYPKPDVRKVKIVEVK